MRGRREFEIESSHDDDGFEIDDYPGVGYIFAVASPDPFAYDPIADGDHWDYRVIADGRVRGDPYVALTDLAQRIVPDSDWDYDIAPYYVEQRYDYPRFLCYDCHSYASYTYWNPYAYSCVRFRIVVYDDPYYYPYRYYGGTRVVFTRPFRPDPRFIFKDRDGFRDDRFVTREREHPVNDNGRRGVRGIDLGVRGSVPVPGIGDRRRDRQVVVPRPSDRWQPAPEQRRSPRNDTDRKGERRPAPEARDGDRRDRSAQVDDQPRRSQRAEPSDRRSADEGRDRVLEAPPRETPPQPRPEVRRPEVPRAEPRAEPRTEAPRDRPRAEPRRDSGAKDKRSSDKPELRRRRP